MTATAPTSSAAGIAWDLNDLYHDIADPRLDADLQAALARAEAFERTYRGNIAALDPTGASTLLSAVQELENVYELTDKAAVYALLVHSARTDDPRHGALLSKTREQRTAINKHLIFFDLEWIGLADEPARALLARPELAKYRHYLEHLRIRRPHILSEPEEKLLDEKSVTGRAAFVRLCDE